MSTMMMTMPGSHIDSWFRSARGRWPRVRWSIERFIRHVGGAEPRHPEDLFLGGAAAEREGEAWVTINHEFRKDVVDRLSRVARAGASPEDLWGDSVAKLISDSDAPDAEPLPDGRKPARIRGYRGDSSLMTFLLVVARNIARDLHRRNRAMSKEGSMPVEELQDHRPPADRPTSEEVMQLARRFAEAMLALKPSQRKLLMLVYGQDMPKGRAGARMGMKDYKVSRELADAHEQLRMRLASSAEGPWSGEAIAVWLKGWGRSPELQGDDA